MYETVRIRPEHQEVLPAGRDDSSLVCRSAHDLDPGARPACCWRGRQGVRQARPSGSRSGAPVENPISRLWTGRVSLIRRGALIAHRYNTLRDDAAAGARHDTYDGRVCRPVTQRESLVPVLVPRAGAEGPACRRSVADQHRLQRAQSNLTTVRGTGGSPGARLRRQSGNRGGVGGRSPRVDPERPVRIGCRCTRAGHADRTRAGSTRRLRSRRASREAVAPLPAAA